jgi:hypothetical protein
MGGKAVGSAFPERAYGAVSMNAAARGPGLPVRTVRAESSRGDNDPMSSVSMASNWVSFDETR